MGRRLRVRTLTFVPPKIELGKPFVEKIGQIIAAGVVDNILKQRQTGGARIRVNAPSTRERKQRQGRPTLSLIDDPKKRRLVKGRGRSFQSGVMGTRGKYRIKIVPATQETRQIVRYVQDKGYTGWFGVHEYTYNAVVELIRQTVKEKWKKAMARRKKTKKVT
jgi:hypothetical protein